MGSKTVSQDFVAHAIGRLLDRARSARKILGELDACRSTRFTGVEQFEAERTRALSSSLKVLGRQLPVLLDLMGMRQTRENFLQSWKAIADHDAIEVADDVNASLISPPLLLIDSILQVLGAGSQGILGEDPADIKTLEYVLRATPQILESHGILPRREADIQRVLHDHLECTFPDYSRSIKLPKGLKSFVPDGAIASLEVLIEVKFVNSEEKAAQIFSGIVEDLSGYHSKDWTRYYSLVYQTEPFVNEIRFDRSLQLTGNAGSWKPIVVTGSGGRSTAPRRGKEIGGIDC